jgi:hypothetical protein
MFMTKYADAPTVIVKEKVLTPTLSPASGSLGHAPCTITATCGTAGATIRYTVDGSDPTATSAVYKGPSVIAADMTVSIRAFKSGMEPSDVTRVSYVFQKTAPEKALITSVSQGDSSSGILVNWSGGAGTESYDILRSESSAMSSTTTIASGLSASTSCHADLTARQGKTYYYQIRSRNKYGTTLSAVSQGAYLMLNPPDTVTATVISTKINSATVKIAWSTAAGASYYRVYRKSSDGTLAALGSWQAGTEYTDTVALSGDRTEYAYYVSSATTSSGAKPSPYSKMAPVSITPSSDGWSLIVCDYDYSSTTDYGTVCLKPGAEKTLYCRLKYADGTLARSEFLESPQWSVAQGSGISLTAQNGSYENYKYVAPRLTISVVETAPEQVATITGTFVTGDGKTITHDVLLIVSRTEVPRLIDISSPVPFLIPGEQADLRVSCTYYDDKYDIGGEALPDGMDVTWNIISGGGATLSEDGVLTAWSSSSPTSVVVQACVETIAGLVTSTRTFKITPDRKSVV